MFNKVILLGVFILSQSCGIKGPPLPPQTTETIQKQKGDAALNSTSTSAQGELTDKKVDPKKSKKK